jgi:hypothetical protein
MKFLIILVFSIDLPLPFCSPSVLFSSIFITDTDKVAPVFRHHAVYSLNKATRVYPNVSGLAAWSENCKWYSSLPLGAVVWLFCESVF